MDIFVIQNVVICFDLVIYLCNVGANVPVDIIEQSKYTKNTILNQVMDWGSAKRGGA